VLSSPLRGRPGPAAVESTPIYPHVAAQRLGRSAAAQVGSRIGMDHKTLSMDVRRIACSHELRECTRGSDVDIVQLRQEGSMASSHILPSTTSQ
jgi:hypothetical protein